MSTKTKLAPARPISTVNGNASVPDPLHMAQDLRAAIISFSENGFRALSQLTDRIPQLEKEVQERDNEIKKLTVQLDTERKDHVVERQGGLQSYQMMYDTFKDERAALQRDIHALNISVQEKDTALVDLQTELEDIKSKGRALGEKYKERGAKLKEKEEHITNLREQLQDARANAEDLSKELGDSKSRVAKLEESLKRSKGEHDSLEKEYNMVNSSLNELRSFAAPLKDVDLRSVANELDNLWKSATIVVGKYLRQDLEDDMLQNDWDGLRDNTIFKHQIPLPRSNSEIAKEMRVATVLAILARLVDHYIFQPTYILDERTELRTLLRRLAMVNETKESFVRGMFLSMFPEEQESEEEAKDRRDWVIGDLIKEVLAYNFLAPDTAVMLGDELRSVLVQAQESWRTVQHSKQRLEPTFRYTHDTNLEWKTFELQTANTQEGELPMSPVSDSSDDQIQVFVIFPRLYIMKKEQLAITAGTVLRQAQLRAAAQEARETVSDTPFTETVLKSRRHRRSRGPSIGGEGAQGGPIAKRFLANKGRSWT